MLTILWPLLIAALGLLVFVWASDLSPRAKAARVGEILLFTGALITLYVIAHHNAKFG